MKSKRTLLLSLLVVFVALFTLNCSNSDANPKPEGELKGDYAGTATNQANSTEKKTLSMGITSNDNPIAGTYKFNGATGKISGSALGLILTLTLKPDAGGTTYTFSGSADDNDTKLTGTLKGVESNTTVTYNVAVSK